MLKLPRLIESDPRHDALVAMLEADAKPLWDGGFVKVPHVPFTPALEAALKDALNSRQLERGLENIEGILRNEQRGLDALAKKQGVPKAQRVSRLLIIADDGAERFYRQCETVLLRHPDRVLALRVPVPCAHLAERLFTAEELVKVLLVSERDAVSSVLLALAPLAESPPAEPPPTT